MSDILLAKPELPEGWLDFTVGEAVVVRNAVLKHFNLSLSQPAIESLLDYPAPNGNKELIKLLEDKYQVPVIITNGCKQALGASFYLLNKLGYKSIGMRLPYWALIPPLVKAHGLKSVFLDSTLPEDYYEAVSYDSYLDLSPNNPDGWTTSSDMMKKMEEFHKEEGIPLIHDAAYYSHSYLPSSHELVKYGDLQLYSVSKMYGLSGLRLGYIVCNNTSYYKTLCEYTEMMTVGVSTASQQLFAQLLWQEKSLGNAYELEAYNNLLEAKRLFKTISSEIIEVPDNFENTPGMFAWVKVKNRAAFNKAQINVIDGDPFGVPGYIRMNLGVPLSMLQEAVDRLNKLG